MTAQGRSQTWRNGTVLFEKNRTALATKSTWHERMKINPRNFLGAAAVATAFAVPALSGPLEDGIDAYHEKAFDKAAAIWRPLAENGVAAAQYLLGTLYVEG